MFKFPIVQSYVQFIFKKADTLKNDAAAFLRGGVFSVPPAQNGRNAVLSSPVYPKFTPHESAKTAQSKRAAGEMHETHRQQNGIRGD